MNQDKIGNLIKEIRKKNNLTQAEFAERYGVTYQAVSKWENGKNIPDIMLLKKISEDFDTPIEALLEGKRVINKKKNNNKIIFIILIIIFIISLIFLIIHFNHDDDFEFKTISANCNNFNISGSIAYNNNKSSIYISNINYCGGEDYTLYKKIKCALYESNGNIETKIDEYDYNDNGIKLEDFFKNVSFHIDNYKRSCKKYNKNSLYLLIDAIDSDDNVTSYRVPLSLTDSCDAQP